MLHVPSIRDDGSGRLVPHCHITVFDTRPGVILRSDIETLVSNNLHVDQWEDQEAQAGEHSNSGCLVPSCDWESGQPAPVDCDSGPAKPLSGYWSRYTLSRESAQELTALFENVDYAQTEWNDIRL